MYRLRAKHQLRYRRPVDVLNLAQHPVISQFAALRVQLQFARELPYVRYSPSTPRLNAIFPFVDPAIEDVLLDLATPDAALKDACRRIEQVLRRP